MWCTVLSGPVLRVALASILKEHHRSRLLVQGKVTPQGLLWTDLPSVLLEMPSSPETRVVRAGKVLGYEL